MADKPLPSDLPLMVTKDLLELLGPALKTALC